MGEPAEGRSGWLTEPYLLHPSASGIEIAWVMDAPEDDAWVVVAPRSERHLLQSLTGRQLLGGELATLLPRAQRLRATASPLTSMAEDGDSRLDGALTDLRDDIAQNGTVPRALWRLSVEVVGLEPGETYAYRAVVDGDPTDAYACAPAPQAAAPVRLLVTSDHQLGPNVPAALEQASQAGPFDAVLYAGDFVNVPDRASEWFDDADGASFFAAMQGNADRTATAGRRRYRGGRILQEAPIIPAVGNHEVQGRLAAGASLSEAFAAARPRHADPEGLQLTSFTQLFSASAGYSAVSFGDVRIVVLHATRVWRADRGDEHPEQRTAASRYQEAAGAVGDPSSYLHGSHIVEDLSAGSAQFTWLQEELASPEFAAARARVVVMHESPHSIGVNAMPHFAHPVQLRERNEYGDVVGVRYDYPRSESILLRDISPLFERSGVDLVVGGHSHLWSRFVSPAGVHYLETSHAGYTHGAFHRASGRLRSRPPARWSDDVVAQGDPGGLEPVVPTVAPQLDADGAPLPYVADGSLCVFSVLDLQPHRRAELVSYVFDVRTPDVPARVFDSFEIGRVG